MPVLRIIDGRQIEVIVLAAGTRCAVFITISLKSLYLSMFATSDINKFGFPRSSRSRCDPALDQRNAHKRQARAWPRPRAPTASAGRARSAGERRFGLAQGVRPPLARYPKLSDRDAAQQIGLRLVGEDPHEFFVHRLSEGIGRIAAAFYPKPVILRTSDFKTNEYAMLLGGKEFEPTEENPRLGFRGAFRYYDPRYAEGFALECQAILRVRQQMGLRNLKVMIPFCRTVEEGRKVLAAMAQHGLPQHQDGLEVYAMCEIPANVILARQFLEVFDGFSIGSNDLTQLVLGIDRDSGTVAHLFDERNDAVREMIALVIATAKSLGKPIGICGQAPSDYPDFARWLVERGIGSISLNPDTAIATTLVIASAEASAAQ